MLRKRLENELSPLLRQAGAATGQEVSDSFIIEYKEPPRSDYGDYSVSWWLRGVNDAASLVAAKMKEIGLPEFVESIEAKDLFINIRLSDATLFRELGSIVENLNSSGASRESTVVVDYLGLNIAKPAHVGHLRSAVIGDAIKRLLLATGYQAVSDSHVGDWGTQFGIVLYAYKTFGDRAKIESDPVNELNRLYVEASKRIDENPEIRELAKAEFAKLEQGDSENRKLWQWMNDISMQKLRELSHRLGLLPFEEHKGESTYEADMPGIVELALKKSVATKKEDGSISVDLIAENLDEAVLVKSDGATTYLLRDLAAIRYRIEKWRYVKNVYVVDTRQAHHFRQVFRVAELLGWEMGENVHAEFGQMKSPEGAMSTRKGNVISLDTVLDEAIARARNVIEQKNPELAEKEFVAEVVGIGALKYFDLSHNRKSDIVFRWDDALSFEGDTGPYLQYTHARLKSILRKAGAIGGMNATSVDSVERNLLMRLVRFPDAVEDAALSLFPNILTNYLFALAQEANNFYHSHPVLQEKDAAKRILRLALVKATANILKRGLYLLGIEAPEEM